MSSARPYFGVTVWFLQVKGALHRRTGYVLHRGNHTSRDTRSLRPRNVSRPFRRAQTDALLQKAWNCALCRAPAAPQRLRSRAPSASLTAGGEHGGSCADEVHAQDLWHFLNTHLWRRRRALQGWPATYAATHPTQLFGARDPDTRRCCCFSTPWRLTGRPACARTHTPTHGPSSVCAAHTPESHNALARSLCRSLCRSLARAQRTSGHRGGSSRRTSSVRGRRATTGTEGRWASARR